MKIRSRRPSAADTTSKIRASNNYNSLEQNDIAENQHNSTNTILSTVPEGNVMSTDGNSTIVGDDFGDDTTISPTSTSGRSFASRLRSNSSATFNDAASFNSNNNSTQRPYTQHGTLSNDHSLSTSGGTTRKVKKILGDDVPQSQKQKEDKPWFLNYDYDPSDMVFNMESSVKGGTLDALVERLTMHDLLDSNFIATFLLTYRSFCTSEEFFDMIVKRFMIQPPEELTPEQLEVWQEKKQTPVRLRVFNIMKTWLETYYIDGEDSHCLERMKEFASTTMHENMAFASVSLTKVIEKRVSVFCYI